MLFKEFTSDLYNEPTLIGAGQTMYIPLNVNMNRQIFKLIHGDRTKQDFGLSTWFSKEIYYNNIKFNNRRPRVYLQQNTPLETSIHDLNFVNEVSESLDRYSVDVSIQGKYYYNVENMTGSEFTFVLSKEEIN